MKNYFISVLLGSMLLTGLSSCFHHHDVSVSISDDGVEYEMDAPDKKGQTHDVQVFVNEHLVVNSKVSVKNRPRNKVITMDNETKFYVNADPREIRIRIDKRENAEAVKEIIKEISKEIDINFEDH